MVVKPGEAKGGTGVVPIGGTLLALGAAVKKKALGAPKKVQKNELDSYALLVHFCTLYRCTLLAKSDSDN